MFNLSTTAPENIRRVATPLMPDDIKEFFVNKDIMFVIDYDKSRLRGPALLTYLSNLDVPCDIDFTGENYVQNYKELMLAYMKQRTICSCGSLAIHLAQLICAARGVSIQEIPYVTAIPAEVIYEFLIENQELVFNWMEFLDSMNIFCIYAIEELNERFKPEENLPVVVDKEFVGHNVVNLFGLPLFFETYTSQDPSKYAQKFFAHQFKDYMFMNQRLVTYFNTPVNFLARAFEALANTDADLSNLEELIAKAKENTNEHINKNTDASAIENGQFPQPQRGESGESVSPKLKSRAFTWMSV